MVDFRSKSSDCQFGSKEHVPMQLGIMKVEHVTLINLKTRASLVFLRHSTCSRTMVHQKAVQMESGKLHPLLPYPKCKVAVPRNFSIPNLRNGRCLSDPFHPISFNPTFKFEWLGSGGPDNELWIPNASSAQLGIWGLLSII
jgi:hypothetical protein